jgi:hypothetical protein
VQSRQLLAPADEIGGRSGKEGAGLGWPDGSDEAVAAPAHRLDEAREPGVVAEHPT